MTSAALSFFRPYTITAAGSSDIPCNVCRNFAPVAAVYLGDRVPTSTGFARYRSEKRVLRSSIFGRSLKTM